MCWVSKIPKLQLPWAWSSFSLNNHHWISFFREISPDTWGGKSHRENICCVCDPLSPDAGNQTCHFTKKLHYFSSPSYQDWWDWEKRELNSQKKKKLSKKKKKKKEISSLLCRMVKQKCTSVIVGSFYNRPIIIYDHSIAAPTQTKPSNNFWSMVHLWHVNSAAMSPERKWWHTVWQRYSDQTYFLGEGNCIIYKRVPRLCILMLHSSFSWLSWKCRGFFMLQIERVNRKSAISCLTKFVDRRQFWITSLGDYPEQITILFYFRRRTICP